MFRFFGKFPSNLNHKEQIDVDLVVWYEPNDKELMYLYTPGSNINFATHKPTQSLTITLVSPDDQKDRFMIHSYSVRHKSMCPKAYFYDGTIFKDQPIVDGHLFRTHPTKVKFDLELVGEGTYITINVIDITTNQIIDCDPQVENGTKT